MPLRLSGEELLEAPAERVFALLTDKNTVATLIPDLESHQIDEQGTLHGVVRPGFSFLRGTLRLAIRIEPAPAERQATMLVAAEGIGTSMEVRSTMVLERAGGGTRLKWSANVESIRGLLAAVSPALIQAAASKVMADGWERLRRHLRNEAANEGKP
jgi:carbon monoxide dehydrogenase subunit G